jgi:hypothetical protein
MIVREVAKNKGARRATRPLACRDYTTFARAFRRRFGHAPGIYVQGDDANPGA